MRENEKLETLKRVVDFAWDNPHSDFYREHWKQHFITLKPKFDSVEEFDAIIPLVTKEDLLEYPNPDDRLFIPKRDVCALVSTSGTTSKNPLFRWHTYHKMAPLYKKMYADGCRTELYMWGYHRSSPVVAVSAAMQEGIHEIVADPRQADEAALHLASRKIDILSSSPSVAIAFYDYIKDKSLLDSIRYITLIGEPLTPATLSFIESRYPNAKIYNLFGFAEAGCNIMMHTPDCEDPYNVFHVNTRDMHVSVDEEKMLTFSTLHLPHPTPLIRYQSGDTGRHVPGNCPCGDTAPRIDLIGRASVDFVRTQGVEVRIEHVERALGVLTKYFNRRLQVNVTEKKAADKTQAHIEIALEKREGVHLNESYLKDLVLAELMHLQLSAQTKLKDAIAAGSFDEPTVVFLEGGTVKEKTRSIRLIQ